MASEREQTRVVADSGSLYTLLLLVSAILLAAASGILLYWQSSVYNYFLFWKQAG